MDTRALRRLCAAIVLQAVRDLQDADPRIRRDAERFFRTAWYGQLCAALGLRPVSLARLRRASRMLIGRMRRKRSEVKDAGHRADIEPTR